jgi:transposase
MDFTPGKEASMAASIPNLYPVQLSHEQRQRMQQIASCGTAPARKVRHAQVLLASDHQRPGGRLTRDQVAAALNMHVNTVDRIRKRFVLEGEAPALNRKLRPAPATPRKLDGQAEAHLVAICCSPAPQGRVRWTLQLLADELKKRRIVTHICAETVRQTLKKTNCSLGVSDAGASPKKTQRASSPRWKMCWTSTPPSTPKTSR